MNETSSAWWQTLGVAALVGFVAVSVMCFLYVCRVTGNNDLSDAPPPPIVDTHVDTPVVPARTAQPVPTPQSTQTTTISKGLQNTGDRVFVKAGPYQSRVGATPARPGQ